VEIKSKHLFIIVSLVAAGVVLYLIFSNPEIVSFFDSLAQVMIDFVINNPVSAYFGAFIISIFGNFTVFLPVPYALAIFVLGGQPFIEPLLLAVICGVGAGIGEISAYLIGRGGRNIIEKKYSKRLNSMKALVDRYGLWAVFLFAASPLPDDTLLIPLGVLKYNLWKALLAAIAGKIVLCAILAYGGRFAWGFVEWIFVGGGAIGTVIGILGTFILLYVFLTIDWGKVLGTETIDAKDVKTDEKEEEGEAEDEQEESDVKPAEPQDHRVENNNTVLDNEGKDMKIDVISKKD